MCSQLCHVPTRSDAELEHKGKFCQVSQVDYFCVPVTLCRLDILRNKITKLYDKDKGASKYDEESVVRENL